MSIVEARATPKTMHYANESIVGMHNEISSLEDGNWSYFVIYNVPKIGITSCIFWFLTRPASHQETKTFFFFFGLCMKYEHDKSYWYLRTWWNRPKKNKIHHIIIEFIREIGEHIVFVAHHAVSYWIFAIVVYVSVLRTTYPTQWMWQFFVCLNLWPQIQCERYTHHTHAHTQSIRYGQLLCFHCCSTENIFSKKKNGKKINCHDFFSIANTNRIYVYGLMRGWTLKLNNEWCMVYDWIVHKEKLIVWQQCTRSRCGAKWPNKLTHQRR